MLDTCTLAVFSEMNSVRPICRLVRPRASSASTSRSRAVSVLSDPHRHRQPGLEPTAPGQRLQRLLQRRRAQPDRDLVRRGDLGRRVLPLVRDEQRLGQPPAAARLLVRVAVAEDAQRLPPPVGVGRPGQPGPLGLRPGQPGQPLRADLPVPWPAPLGRRPGPLDQLFDRGARSPPAASSSPRSRSPSARSASAASPSADSQMPPRYHLSQRRRDVVDRAVGGVAPPRPGRPASAAGRPRSRRRPGPGWRPGSRSRAAGRPARSRSGSPRTDLDVERGRGQPGQHDVRGAASPASSAASRLPSQSPVT